MKGAFNFLAKWWSMILTVVVIGLVSIMCINEIMVGAPKQIVPTDSSYRIECITSYNVTCCVMLNKTSDDSLGMSCVR